MDDKNKVQTRGKTGRQNTGYKREAERQPSRTARKEIMETARILGQIYTDSEQETIPIHRGMVYPNHINNDGIMVNNIHKEILVI